jgi:cytochrome c-type biogenesis protein
MENSGHISIIISFWAGMASFLSPCVLPLFPAYLSFVSGISIEDFENSTQNRRIVISNSICFIMGFFLIFICLGASVSIMGSFLFSYQEILKTIGGLLIIFFGLYIAGFLKINILMQYKQLQIKQKPAGYFGSFLVGASFGLGWTPCVGPILGSILILAGTSENTAGGVSMLIAYSLGMAIPFFLGSLAINVFFKFFKFFRKYLHIVHLAAGIILIIVGVLLLTDYMTVLNSYATSLTPKWLWNLL